MENIIDKTKFTEKQSNDFYLLLASVPSPKGSMRCGGSCEHYSKHNSVSGCFLFDDRRKCTRSNKQRRTTSNTSKRRGNTANWY